MNFFEWLFQLGIGLQGDPNYYTRGQASQAEFNNLFSIATKEINNLAPDNPVRNQYYQTLQALGAFQGDAGYYSNLQASVPESQNLINTVSSFFKGGGSADMPGGQPVAAPTAPATPAASAPGVSDTNPATLPGVLAGGHTIGVTDGGVSRYYQVYEFPAGSGNWVSYQFNDLAQAEATLGRGFPHGTWSPQQFNTRVIAEAGIGEVVGQSGDWNSLTTKLMREAAAAAGVRDPGLVGRIASNPEMQQILAQAMIGKWTPEQIKAEQRKTNFWKNELYPGIENFYNSTADPERAWVQYRGNVEPALKALGYKADADGTFNSQVKSMLDKKIDAETFQTMTPVFIQATQNAEFAGVLSQWAQRDLGKTIGFGEWFKLMAGESIPELEAVAERAQMQWVADNQGSQISQQQIESLADRTQMSQAQMGQMFSEFNQSILALGDEALGRYGLSRDEVLSAAAGVTGASGRSVDEVKMLVAKTAREQGLADDEKINFYVGFSPQGTPMRPGLQTLAPEGA
jgi:hypothetical protein